MAQLQNFSKNNSFSNFSNQRTSFVKATQGLHSTIIIISLAVWLFSCVLLLCDNPVNAVDSGEVGGTVNCRKDKYGNNNCTCPADPITARYVDHESDKCEFFYLCHLGVAIKMMCQQWWAFHPKLKECMPRDRIPRTVCTPVVDCPVFTNKYVEDPNDCGRYYLCFAGKYFHWSCPQGQYYEPYKERCMQDNAQAEACMESAKKVLFERLGYNPETKIPVSAQALTNAKAYMKARPKVQVHRQKG